MGVGGAGSLTVVPCDLLRELPLVSTTAAATSVEWNGAGEPRRAFGYLRGRLVRLAGFI